MYKPRKNSNPSFSSSLLDEIYRSIDEQRNDHESSVAYKETNGFIKHERDVQVDFKRSLQRSVHSCSSSSDSSSVGGFSSSEAESVHCVSSRPKPIRTSTNHRHYDYEYNSRAKQTNMNMYSQMDRQFEEFQLKQKQKQEGKFVKTKSRAMKIYGDLKKVKQQPVSPGGRLATFLNSIFTTSNNTNKNTNNTMNTNSCSSANASTCSSASSFSRSCLSKTPSSRGKLTNTKKRSVRFLPVSDEYDHPSGHKSTYEHASNNHQHAPKPVKNLTNNEHGCHSNDKTRRIEEAARNLLRNYQKKVECEYDLITNNVKLDLSYEDDNEDDDNDAASHTSSDLFELENFSSIGMEDDELPVYETTELDTSLANGNRFRM